MRHTVFGRKGEELASQYLEDKGYCILERSFRYSHYEIDIICSIGDIIVFVEVKTRNSSLFGYPEEDVNSVKEAHMENAAEYYIETNEIENEIRFDIISIIINEEETTIHHIEDAFFPGS